MKWQNALKDYRLYLKIQRGLSKNSIDNYTLDVKQLVQYLEEHQIPDSPISITSEIVQQFIYELAKMANARTQSRTISGLRSFFNYLVFEDYRPDNPLE